MDWGRDPQKDYPRWGLRWPGFPVWRLMIRVMRQFQLPRESVEGAQSGSPTRLPIYFFATSIFFFALGTASAPWAAARLNEYFYQLPVLAWVHIFTLGWITPAILGAMFCYAPTGATTDLGFPRLAIAQVLLYWLGATGVMAHFLLGSWDGVWMAGMVVAATVVMFALNVVPWMAPKFGRGGAETGLLIALFFLLCASCLGTLLAFDKERNLLAGTVMSNLSAHAHLAVLGWVTVAICALSYRFMTAMARDKPRVPHWALAQILALAAVSIGLSVTLIAGVGGVTFWAGAAGALLIAYAIKLRKFAGLRLLTGDPVMRHANAGLFFLALAISGGIYLAAGGINSMLDARLAAAYGVAGLLGWVSNFIIGMSYGLFPELVARIRSALDWPFMSVEELSINAARSPVFYVFNAGVLIMAAGLVGGQLAIAKSGAALIAIGGIVYSVATGWTLSFAYRRGGAEADDRLLRAAQD